MGEIVLPRRVLLRADLLVLPTLTPGGVRAADLLPTPAQGRVTHVLGRVLDRHGGPLPGLLVEVWQCDAHGRYLARGDSSWFARRPARDPGFQGYGRTLTDAGGGYRFRTIRPVPYPGRRRHIHCQVRQ